MATTHDELNLVPGVIEHEITEVPVLATSSSEISVPTKPSIEAPGQTTKENGITFARYVAGFWLVRTALSLTESTLCLIVTLGQTLGTSTPLLEPLNSLRRTIRSVLDGSVESLPSGIDDPVKNIVDDKVSSNTDGQIGSNLSPNAHNSNEVKNHEDAKDPVDAMDDSEEPKNPVEAADEPILKTEIRKSERELVIKEAGTKKTEFEACAADAKEASTTPTNIEELEEEALRKSFAQPVQDLQPIKLKTYEKRMDDIVEVESNNVLNNLEVCDIEALDTTDEYKTEDDMTDEYSYDKALSLDEPSTRSSILQDQHYPLLLEHTFLGPPAPTPASTRRYPGFRHLYVYEPYQTRYGSLGPVEDLLDDLIMKAVELSSSGATSTLDDPSNYPLPDDTFESSFESNEF